MISDYDLLPYVGPGIRRNSYSLYHYAPQLLLIYPIGIV